MAVSVVARLPAVPVHLRPLSALPIDPELAEGCALGDVGVASDRGDQRALDIGVRQPASDPNGRTNHRRVGGVSGAPGHLGTVSTAVGAPEPQRPAPDVVHAREQADRDVGARMLCTQNADGIARRVHRAERHAAARVKTSGGGDVVVSPNGVNEDLELLPRPTDICREQQQHHHPENATVARGPDHGQGAVCGAQLGKPRVVAACCVSQVTDCGRACGPSAAPPI
jgi:hypothetical protein